jgi:hypothetical protein
MGELVRGERVLVDDPAPVRVAADRGAVRAVDVFVDVAPVELVQQELEREDLGRRDQVALVDVRLLSGRYRVDRIRHVGPRNVRAPLRCLVRAGEGSPALVRRRRDPWISRRARWRRISRGRADARRQHRDARGETGPLLHRDLPTNGHGDEGVQPHADAPFHVQTTERGATDRLSPERRSRGTLAVARWGSARGFRERSGAAREPRVPRRRRSPSVVRPRRHRRAESAVDAPRLRWCSTPVASHGVAG